MKRYVNDFVIEPQRHLPIYRRVDVVVVGGGPSGIAAAVSAARNGADVLMLERNASPGGTGAMAYVSEFHSTENISGIAREVVVRLSKQGGTSPDFEPESSHIAYDPEVFKFVIMEMLQEAGVHSLYYTWTVDAIVRDRQVQGVIIENKSGRQAVLADVVIDASGDADIAARAGAGMQPHVEPQPMTMMFRMGGIDFPAIQHYARANPQEFSKVWGVPPNDFDGARFIHVSGWNSLIREGKADGRLPPQFGNYISVYGMTPSYLRQSMGIVYATRVLHKDPFDADDLSEGEIDGRRQVWDCLPFVKTLPGFERAYLIDVAPNIGVRDSRRILGDYTLTRDDIFANRVFEDDIAVTVHRGPNIRGWRMHPSDGSEGSREHWRTVLEMPMSVIVHGIPYRCLLPKAFDGLLVAGKTISMDYETHARCRDQPECMAFGQAAGVAAALASRHGISVREVSVADIRALLVAQGVNLDRDAVNVAKIKRILKERGREVVDA